MRKYLVVTNNPLCARGVSQAHELSFYEGADLLGVLIAVRAKIHEGHTLVTHPLTSSLKPNETPYKTVLLRFQQESLCYESLDLIESAIRVYETFARNSRHVTWSDLPPNVLDDLALIDYDMIKEAI